MGTPLGAKMYSIWMTLYRRSLISTDTIVDALIIGQLPYNFAQHLEDLDTLLYEEMQADNLAGPGFCNVPWVLDGQGRGEQVYLVFFLLYSSVGVMVTYAHAHTTTQE